VTIGAPRHSGFRLIRTPGGAAASARKRPEDQRPSQWLLAFGLIFVAILVPHLPLLTLPYFWDEAGYYIPAAHDLLLTGSLIPHSTVSNAHPPLVMIYLALWWKIAGFQTVVTRVAMLLIAALALTAIYRLAYRVANREVAIASTITTALFPVFFTQSTMAHLDMAAGAFTLWGLVFYVEERPRWCMAMFTLAVLAKETAIIAPLALLARELIARRWALRRDPTLQPGRQEAISRALWLLVPIAPLAFWFAFHFVKTGYVFGNSGFFQYNVTATLSPLRVLLALAQRVWQLAGYLNAYVLTLATAGAMFLRPQPKRLRNEKVRELKPELRQRIAIPTQVAFLFVIVAYLVALSVIGGAELARYLLPAFPLWIIICVSTIHRRVRWSPAVIAAVCIGFAAALVTNGPYRIAPEDTLAYRDFDEIQQAAAQKLSSAYPAVRVLTAWPATDELTRPYLGYVPAALPLVLPLKDFSEAQVSGAIGRKDYDVVLIFATKYEPAGGSPADRFRWWRRANYRWFDYHADLQPEAAASALHARVVWTDRRGRFWAAILQPSGVERSQ
jgi:4-amino-4-deoxy-L-arabinose transferase-like glycosyltransferase